MFKDENGIPVALDGDGGDSLQRSGAWAAGSISRGIRSTSFPRLVIHNCYVGNGKWIRHPGTETSPKFWSDPKDMSRDQLLNAFVIARLGQDPGVLFATTCRLASRFLFTPNGDWMIAQLSLVIRCWYPFSLILWPMLVITDLGLLFGAIAECVPWRWVPERKWFGRRNPNDADVDNAVLQYLIAWYWMPTPIAWLARHIHQRFMMKTEGSLSLKVENRLAGAMYWKHRPEAQGDQDLAKLWRGWLEEFT